MYNLFYNLNDRPFDLKPDLKYFYITRSHKRAIEHMRVGFARPDGVLILTGEKGVGKTTLIAYMLDQLNKSDNIVAVIQKPPQKTRDFLLAILAALKISIADEQPKVLFDTLHKFLLEQAKLNKKVRLVIDDAEDLPHNCLELIRLLSAVRLNEHGLLQTVLVGSNELEVALTTDENQTFSQQISMSYCMQPLQVSDTREYIEHRLKVAGWNGDPIIDEDAFGAIHQLTGGVPYAIHRYCGRLLMLGMLRETHHITNKDVSNLTAATMERLEKIDAAWPEQPSTPHSKTKNAAPVQQTAMGIDIEEFFFDTPVKTSKQFINKQTIVTIVAACLVVSLSGFVFNKMSENDPAHLSATTSITHSDGNDHSIAEASADSHESASETVKYVLKEIPAESSTDVKLGSNAPETELLDIQLLLKKSELSNTEVTSDQSTEGLASETSM